MTPRLLALVACLVAAGCGQEDLAEVGLNTDYCTERLVGGKICGDELRDFCRARYDEQLNGEVCRVVLKDAGLDPDRVAADIAEKEREQQEQAELREEDRLERARRAAEITGARGEWETVGEMAYRVISFDYAERIYGEYDIRLAREGAAFVTVSFEYRNDGSEPRDVLCAFAAAELEDDRGRSFSLDGQTMAASLENEAACAGDQQPGEVGQGLLIFEVADDVSVERLLIWEPGTLGPEDASPYVTVEAPDSINGAGG